MTGSEFDPDAVIEAMSAFLALPISAEYRQGVAIHLKAAHAIAQAVLDVELPDEAEPAPVFSP
jgi:Protein of unknown function (DUF4089)